MGTTGMQADEKANLWLEENPDIEVINMRYQQSGYGDHSICIFYTKRNPYENQYEYTR
jgi:hypothetical protein